MKTGKYKSEKTDRGIQIVKIEIGIYQLENKRRKYESGNINRKIPIGRYKSEDINRIRCNSEDTNRENTVGKYNS